MVSNDQSFLPPHKTLTRTALILAAGLGTRMEHFTQDRPKPLLPVWGKPLIDHLLRRLLDYGIQQVIVNVHYLSEKLETHLLPWRQYFSELTILKENTLRGSGGTLLRVCELLQDNDSFFVFNGDVLWKEEGIPALGHLDQMWDLHHKGILAVVRTPDAWGYEGNGDLFLDKENAIQMKKSQHIKAPFVFAGMQILSPQLLQTLTLKEAEKKPPVSIQLFWRHLIQQKNLLGCVFPSPWYHIGTKAAYERIGYV